MKLLVSGTVALDNVKTPSGIKRLMLGGSASHFCMSASLLTDVCVSGIIGKDFPRQHLRLFEDKGIDLRSVMRSEGKTFCWSGEYKAGDLNSAITLTTELGVLKDFKPCITVAQRRIPYVFLANDDPCIQAEVLRQMDHPQFVGMDSMNLWITHKRRELRRLIQKVNFFVANDSEARMLTGETNLIKAARSLRHLGPAFIVIKKGEHGVLFFGDRYSFALPAFPVEKVVDPTGAGDTFAGGLMGFLARQGKINEAVFRKAVCYATVLASFNVQGFGVTRTAGLTMKDVQDRLKVFLRFASPC